MDTAIAYKKFQEHNCEYMPEYWARCRALYAGGAKLLLNQPVMQSVFPQHNAEFDPVYHERCQRSFYLNYAGSVVDLIVAGLFREQPHAEAEPAADKWYDEWLLDVSRPGGQVMSFTDLLKHQILTALQLKRAWTLIELPGVAVEDVAPQSLADQEAAGALDCYAYPVEPECVRDWEVNDDGELEWVLLAFKRCKRDGISGDRKHITEEFVYYTPAEWARYEITYPENKAPSKEEMVPLVAQGSHSFGKVPLCMLELSDGMWAMGKLESIAAGHMNLSNALNWATIKSLFPTPTAFLGEEIIGNKVSEDDKRAVKQARGPANVVVLGKDDRFEFVGPPSEPFAQAMAQADRLRDEMYRVVHSMAASVDNSGAALQRSGQSKQMDHKQTATVLKWLSEIVCKHAVEMLNLVGAGRGDPEVAWKISGMEEYDSPEMTELLAEAQAVDTISIPSATFNRLYKFKIAKEVLGDDADGDELTTIQEELEQSITQESYEAGAMLAEAAANATEENDDESMTDTEDMPTEKPAKQKKGKKGAANMAAE